MTDWNKLLEKRRSCKSYDILEYHACNAGDCGHSVQDECNDELVQQGHASLEPLLLRAIEALEDIKRHSNGCSVCGASELADTAIAEIKAELELNEKE